MFLPQYLLEPRELPPALGDGLSGLNNDFTKGISCLEVYYANHLKKGVRGLRLSLQGDFGIGSRKQTPLAAVLQWFVPA